MQTLRPSSREIPRGHPVTDSVIDDVQLDLGSVRMKEAIGCIAIVHRDLLQLDGIPLDSLQAAADCRHIRALQIASEPRSNDGQQSIHFSRLG
jgi:hypothetical protein